MALDPEFRTLLDAMKQAGGILNDAAVPWALGGGLACWARGGPETEHDVDFLIKPADAPMAQDAFAAAGLKTERPPEGWLLKTWIDVLTQKVLALSEQQPDFSSVLELARSLREQVDWDVVRERTSDSPFAKAYFTLLEELEILPALQKKN